MTILKYFQVLFVFKSLEKLPKNNHATIKTKRKLLRRLKPRFNGRLLWAEQKEATHFAGCFQGGEVGYHEGHEATTKGKFLPSPVWNTWIELHSSQWILKLLIVVVVACRRTTLFSKMVPVGLRVQHLGARIKYPWQKSFTVRKLATFIIVFQCVKTFTMLQISRFPYIILFRIIYSNSYFGICWLWVENLDLA